MHQIPVQQVPLEECCRLIYNVSEDWRRNESLEAYMEFLRYQFEFSAWDTSFNTHGSYLQFLLPFELVLLLLIIINRLVEFSEKKNMVKKEVVTY
jgi:hypothetical protein